MKAQSHSSVRWRIILIYFLLVFIAMTIVSVFLTDRIENYQMSSLRRNITGTVTGSNLLSFLGSFDSLQLHAEEIRQALDDSWTSGFTQEVSVVGSSLSVEASTNRSLQGKSAAEVFDTDILTRCLTEKTVCESDGMAGDIPVKNLCFAVQHEGVCTGAVYVRADLSSINSFMRQAKMIFIEATLLALGITVLLGFALARSITVPINDLTEKVHSMSQGDFAVRVPVKSTDEIGQLAEMFNLLAAKLGTTITEINNEKNKLGIILQNMADGLIAIDLSGRLLHANPAARRFMGLSADARPEGCLYDEVMNSPDESLSLQNIREKCRDGRGQIIFRRENETYVVLSDRFPDEKGNDAGIILVLQDISERQKLEDMQTEFVANVSHELKTPLTNIKSYTETLLDGALDDRRTAIGFLQIVDKEADRMNRLVKDLLQLSRLDHQKEPMHLRESNIVLLVNMAIMKVELTAKQKNIAITSLYDIESDIRVNLDKDRMEQVVMNILSNAIKYTNDGGRIDVDIQSEKDKVRISVKDTGIGIPEDALPRIFERFYRVDKARSRAMGGTGLGLAITKEIVDSHGGYLEAESKVGEGTKISVVLPAAVTRGVKNID